MSNKNSDIKSVSIRIPLELLQKLRYIADYEERSVNNQVIYWIREYMRDFEEKHGVIE